MAELAAGLVGAAVTVGAGALTTASGFIGRHEYSHHEQLMETKRNMRCPAGKRLTQQANHSLRSLNWSMHSGSPPGSNMAVDDLREWTYNVDDNSSGSDLEPDHETQRSSNLGERLQIFLPHAPQFGFFLDLERFLQLGTAEQAESSTSSHPLVALLSAVDMWAAHLASDPREESFKNRALYYAATDLDFSDPQLFMYTIQAQVLLSYYFFWTDRLMAARTHAATAVALATGEVYIIFVIGVEETEGGGIFLPVPSDAVEEGERINGFWAVFTLQQNLSVALNPAPLVYGVFEALHIDTPWPLEMEQYRQGLLTSDIRGDSTLRSYLSKPMAPTHGDDGSSITAMNVKACILLHRSIYLQGQCQWAQERESSMEASRTTFDIIDELIESLRAKLRLENLPCTPTIVLTYSLLDAATITLHNIFKTSDATSRQRCLDAAQAMFRFTDADLRRQHLNPIMGTLWLMACDVFITELRSVGNGSHADVKDNLYSNLKTGLGVISTFDQGSLLMRNRRKKLEHAMVGFFDSSQ
ncbi:hypothetical protein B0H13DRAFT_2017507 [Mycena leptocephala]|nr:hypothetical protein B0H13DRAFT_2017507 [Mycena leptocephala]